MKELKFRVFVGGQFYYWGFFDNGNGMQFQGLPSSNVEPLSFKELQERSQQLVRLNNGIEFYEGDLVHLLSNYDTDDPIDCIAKVVFADGAFRLDFHNMLLGSSLFDPDSNWSLTHAGNIHENADLLP